MKIGLDTNVLLRFLLRDEPAGQSAEAATLVATAEGRGDTLHLDSIVLAEAVWTLQTRYRLTRREIAERLEDLLETRVFRVDERSLVRRAIDTYRQGPAGFADYLLVERYRAAGLDGTATFDRKLQDGERIAAPLEFV